MTSLPANVRAEADRALALSRYQDAEHRVRKVLATLDAAGIARVAQATETMADQAERISEAWSGFDGYRIGDVVEVMTARGWIPGKVTRLYTTAPGAASLEIDAGHAGPFHRNVGEERLRRPL
jgi:hypothetical protein